MSTVSRTRKLVGTAMLAAVSVVLMFLAFPVPLMPSFIKLDLAELGLGDFTQLGDFIGVEEASLADGVLRLGSQTSAVLIP